MPNAVLELANLDGLNGFVLNGANDGDLSGYSVSGVGDVNGDGLDDFIVGAIYVDPNGYSNAGASYVVFGKLELGRSGFMELSELDGANGFVLNGVSYDYETGHSVSGAGDVNGDGIDDFIVGAINADPGGRTNAGASYVIFGKTGLGSAGVMELSQLSSTDGFVLNGVTSYDQSGHSVHSAGDVNGDGMDDLIIGAPYAHSGGRSQAGVCYVVFGKIGLGSGGMMELSQLGSADGFVLNGAGTNDESGYSVSNAGDVNGDGIGDLIVRTRTAGYGASVVFGAVDLGSNGAIDLGQLNGVGGFVLNGVSGDFGEVPVSGAGDVNGDGVDDLIVGAIYADPGGRNSAGASYVVFGKAGLGSSGVLDLSKLSGADGFVLNGVSNDDQSGFSVSGVGDVNGDGVDDLIVGSRRADPGGRNDAGVSYVVFGKIGLGSSGVMELSQLSREDGLILNGVSSYDESGYSVSGIGDVNGDGIDDFIVGARWVDPGGRNNAGASYVIFGATLGLANNTLNISQGETLLLTASALQATYLNVTPDTLHFTVSQLQHGQFELVNQPGLAITTFTQEAVDSRNIQFVHDGSTSAPSYRISVSDGLTTLDSEPVMVDFNLLPVLVNNQFAFNQGEVVTIAPAMLRATDADNDELELQFTMSQVQAGQFEMTENPGVAITQFAQSDIDVGSVVFIHDGSTQPPYFLVRVSDGRITVGPAGSTITFNQVPLIANNQLSVNQGESVRLSSAQLKATDGDNSPTELQFSVSQVQHGQFELSVQSGVSVTQFTQQQINAGEVLFVSDGSAQIPTYTVTVSDGQVSVGPEGGLISFNQSPVPIHNQLTINQNETLILSPTELRVTDGDNTAAQLTFDVSQVQAGQFEMVANPGVAMTQFSQAQINSGQIVFVHDGSTTAPSYTVSVSDGKMAVFLGAASVSFNQAPVLVSNTLVLNQGDSITFSQVLLEATDNDDVPADIRFTAGKVQSGQFEFLGSPGTSITQFSQAQINAGEVVFVHDGSAMAPGYDIVVSDGAITTEAVSASVRFNQIPELVNNHLSINQGEARGLTSADLQAIDGDNIASELQFSISQLAYGQFERVNNPNVAITTFTQADIDANQIRFVHDGSTYAPNYQVSVSDGTVVTPPQWANVVSNQFPTLVNNQLIINQGESHVISNAELLVTDDNPPNQLVYTVSNVSAGQFELTSSLDNAITSFTQADVDAARVRFVHDGSTQIPHYDVMVSDGGLSVGPLTGRVDFNWAPQIINNQLVINQGERWVLTSANLLASDADNTPDELSYAISGIQHGQFEHTGQLGVAITRFTQVDVLDGAISFVHDGGTQAPSYQVSLSDGRQSTVMVFAEVLYNVAPKFTHSALSMTQGERNVITSDDIQVLDTDNGPDEITIDVVSITYGQFERVSQMGSALTRFTQQDINSGQIVFAHDDSLHPPTVTLIATDGTYSTESNAVLINFNTYPALMNNQLVANQGDTILITPTELQATDSDNGVSELVFTLTQVQGGQFELVNAPGTAISNFTQMDIDAGQIQFVLDNGTEAPSYRVTVSDGQYTTPEEAANISYNQPPQLVNNQLLLNEGETHIVTNQELLIVDNDNLAGELQFIVSDVAHGQFELLSKPGVSVTTFTQAQINAQDILFVHDGGQQAPTFKTQISDGKFTSATAVAAQTGLNQLPVLLNNQLVINQGETKVLGLAELRASDDETEPGDLIFHVSEIRNGYFEFYSNAGVAVTQFSQRQIENAVIRFVHDGSRNPAEFMVSVEDSHQARTLPQPAQINFTVGPRLESYALVIEEGQRLIVSLNELRAVDAETEDNLLTFLISEVVHGQFERQDNPGQAITQFQQQQISLGDIVFVHDGSPYSPSFRLRVDNGQTKTAFITADITFRAIAPVFVHNQLMVDEGVVTRLSLSELSAEDGGEVRDDIVFTVESISGGYFEFFSNPGVEITQFNQGQLRNRNVQFVPTSQGIAPSYNLTVSDGVAVSAAQAANITFNGAPYLAHNGFWVNQGYWVLLNDSMLQAVDGDNAPEELTFYIGDLANGWFRWHNGSERVTEFTQAQVDSAEVIFEADDSGLLPQYGVRVSDGRIMTERLLAVIDYNRRPRVERLPQNREVQTREAFDFRYVLIFSDPDRGDSLTVTAYLADGGVLPTTINFDAAELRFWGQLSEPTSYDIQLKAFDKRGLTAQTGFSLRATEQRQWWQTVIGPGLAVTAVTTIAGLAWRRHRQRQYRKQYELADALRKRLRLELHDFSSGDGAQFVSLVGELLGRLSSERQFYESLNEEQRGRLVESIATTCEGKAMLRGGSCLGRRHNRQHIDLTALRYELDNVAALVRQQYSGLQSAVTTPSELSGAAVELGRSQKGSAGGLVHNASTLFNKASSRRPAEPGAELVAGETPPPPPPPIEGLGEGISGPTV